MKLLNKYLNGNVTVTLFDNGTKIQEWDDNEGAHPDYPNSMDIKITGYCDRKPLCAFCHEKSDLNGKHADLEYLLDILQDLPKGTELACLKGDSVVYSENGAIEISDLKIGDYIFDSIHNLVKINNIVKTNKKVYQIKGNKGFNVLCSDDHPFMSNDLMIKSKDLLDKKVDLLELKEDFKLENYTIDLAKYVNKADITKKGSRGGKIEEDRVQLSSSNPFIKRHIKIDEELMWMYGLIVAEGSKKSITLNINEAEYSERFIRNYADIFGLECNVYKNFEKNSINIEPVSPKSFQSLFFEALEIGYGARNKTIQYLFKIDDKELIRSALNGLFDGDGCYRKRKTKKFDSFSLSYKTSSKKLAYELIYLLKKYFDVTATLYHGMNKERKIEDRVLKPSDYYKIDIYNKNDILKIFPDIFKDEESFNKIGEYKYSTKGGLKENCVVTNIIDLNYEEDLYDLTLEESSSHIFPVNGYFLTHNCGGGNPLAHPSLVPFLETCRSFGLIPNLTINYTALYTEKYIKVINKLIDEKLVYGVGLSIPDDFTEYFVSTINNRENVVYHVIAGVNELSILDKIKKSCVQKCLILGYKDYGRGVNYRSQEVTDNLQNWTDNLGQYIKKIHLSFDNLALKQLDIKQYLTDDEWSRFYCGTDGAFTMYIDAIEQKYAMSSTNPIKFPLVGNIKDIFANINSQVVV